VELPPFAELAAAVEPRLDLLALALAGEFREVAADDAIATLDGLGAELLLAATHTSGSAEERALACAQLLGATHGFEGDRERYDEPDNSMLDIVLARRRGLPILLSVVYVEVARRAAIALDGVGLPGHFVVGCFAIDPPLLLDPFHSGRAITAVGSPAAVRPWGPHEIAMRILNNLIAAYSRRGNVGAAIAAARMRLMLPAPESMKDTLQSELRTLQASLN
jgi:hypothetical protein